MNIKVFKDYDKLSKATSVQIINTVNKKPDSLIALAAGNTPLKTFEYLIKAVRDKLVNFGECRFVGLDEWVGMDKNTVGSCQHLLYQNFFDPLKIKPPQIHFFNARSNDLENECNLIDKFIMGNGPIDILLLGLGVNGHLGLNEPGVSFELYSHVIEIEAETQKVAQKYFDKPQKVSEGITLGIKHFMEAEQVILMASGNKKANAVKRLTNDKVTVKVPASVLQKHKNCFINLDRLAAFLI